MENAGTPERHNISKLIHKEPMTENKYNITLLIEWFSYYWVTFMHEWSSFANEIKQEYYLTHTYNSQKTPKYSKDKHPFPIYPLNLF